MAKLRTCERKMKTIRDMMSEDSRAQWDADITEIMARKRDFNGSDIDAANDFLEEQRFALDDIYTDIMDQAGVSVAPKQEILASRSNDRLQRARDLGFDTEQTYYHGTAESFGAFDNDKLGSTTGHPQTELGHFFSKNPETANFFATNVVPVFLKGNYKPISISEFRAMDSGTTHEETREMRAEAEAEGFDGFEITGQGSDGEIGVKIVFNPNQIRSVNAQFEDTASPEILASRAAPESKADRLARAKDAGFDTDKVWYHGTISHDIQAFDNAWFTENPDYAEVYTDVDTPRDREPAEPRSTMYPVYLQHGVVDFRTRPDLKEEWKHLLHLSNIAAPLESGLPSYLDRDRVLKFLREKGIDTGNGVVFDEESNGGVPNVGVYVTDSSKVRSVNAQFEDTASSDLLASRADARLQRARNAGFDTEKIWKHITTEEFTAFNNMFTRGQLGFHLGTQSQSENMIEGIEEEGDQANELNLYVRVKNSIRLDDLGSWQGTHVVRMVNEKAGLSLNDSASDRTIRAALIEKGFDSVIYKNEFEGNAGEDSLIVFNPSDIKSVDAQFEDTASTDLLANRSNPGETNYSRAEAQAVVTALNSLVNKAGLGVEVVNSEDVPAALGESAGVKGYIIGNTAYLVHDNIESDHDAYIVYMHELKGHLGVNNIIQDWDGVVTSYNEMKDEGTPEFKNIHSELMARYGEFDLTELQEVKEFIAIAAERAAKNSKSTMQKFMQMVRDLWTKGMRALNFNRPFSVDDINLILSRSEQFLATENAEQVMTDAIQNGEVLASRGEDKDGFTPGELNAMAKIGSPKPPTFRQKFNNRNTQNLTVKIQQGVIDQYRSFRNILKDDQAWMMAHMTKSGTGALDALIEHGNLNIDQHVIGVNTDTKGLREILKPLGLDLDRFFTWMAGHHANKLKGQDRENLFTEENIQDMMKMDRGREELFASVKSDFDQMAASINTVAVKTGLLNAEQAMMWAQEGIYLPFYRVLDEQKDAKGPRVGADQGLVRQSAYRVLKGSPKNVDDLLENTMLNWNHLLTASLSNQAAAAALDSAVEMGIAREIPRGEKAEPGEKTTFVRKAGAQKWYAVDTTDEGNLVMESLLALNWNGLNGNMMKAGRKFKRALTYGVTVNPEFKIRNLLRDSINAIAVSKVSPNIPKNWIQGAAATGKKSDTYHQLLAGGGIFGDTGYIHGGDPDAIKYSTSRGVKRDTILDTRWRLKRVFDLYQEAGARLENINRAADYVQNLSRVKSGEITKLEAMFMARDHLDFTRTGAWTLVRGLAQLVPFLNARLQGLDKLGRAAWKKEDRSRFYLTVGTYSMMAVGLYLMMKDDDDYKAAEQWERDSYHLFKIPGDETMYRIPRPFEVGAIASLAERTAEQMVDDDVHGALFLERLSHSIFETFNFNPLHAAFLKPALEVSQNKNWFTKRAIESQSMKSLSPQNRKRAWTSETAIAASQGMALLNWDAVTLSPVQIEHMVRGYFGWLGSTTLGAADILITRNIIDAPVNPEKRLTEYTLLKAFARSGPNRNTRYTTKFYEDMNEIREAYANIRQAKEYRNHAELKELYRDNRDKMAMQKMYNKANKQIQKINAQMTQTRLSRKLSAKEKQVRMDRLTSAKNRWTQSTVERSGDVFN